MSLSFFGWLCLTHKKERRIEVREGKREKSREGGKESIIYLFLIVWQIWAKTLNPLGLFVCNLIHHKNKLYYSWNIIYI
jgi:hypothetical protein